MGLSGIPECIKAERVSFSIVIWYSQSTVAISLNKCNKLKKLLGAK